MAVALVVRQGEAVCFEGAVGVAEWTQDGRDPLRPFTAQTKVRVASVSKLAVAMLALKLEAQGKLDLDAPVTDVLPDLAADATGKPVTLRALLSHTGGVRDGEVYWQSHPGDIRTLLAQTGQSKPGFRYANINFGLIASVLEVRLGQRFDALAREALLAPMGLTAGFNWSGVPEAARESGAALLWRDEAGVWQIEVDVRDQRLRQPAAVLMEPDATLDSYRLGQNGTLFSPQGGLRASAADLSVLAQGLSGWADAQAVKEPIWTAGDLGAPETEGGFYRAFSTGVHLLRSAQWPQGVTAFGEAPLLGHAGEAYGLISGAWFAPDTGLAFGFVATGVSKADHQRLAGGLTPIEAELLVLAGRAASDCKVKKVKAGG
jgi:CubicO group peptidase (beta-lactamase class C family)